MKKYTGIYLIRKNPYSPHAHVFEVHMALKHGIEKAIILAKIPDLRLEHRNEYAQWFPYIERVRFYHLLDELISEGELIEKKHGEE